MRILVVDPKTTAGLSEKIAAAARLAAAASTEIADLAVELQAEFGVPVIDGVGAAVKQAEPSQTLGLTTSKRGAYALPMPKTYSRALEYFAPKRAMS
jgi:Asp/Glu/hydantoin racemase